MARHRQRQRLGARAAALSVVAALFLCVNACATPTSVHLDSAPASKLYLSLAFTNMLVAANQVSIEVRFSTRPNNWVQLANNQHLTINGRGPDSSPRPPSYAAGIPIRCRVSTQAGNTPSPIPTSVGSKRVSRSQRRSASLPSRHRQRTPTYPSHRKGAR